MGKNRVSADDPRYGSFLEIGAGRYRPNAVAQRESILRGMYERVLTELAANRFKWTGLPAEIDVRYMELTLLRRALCVFFLDNNPTFGARFMALPATASGQRNVVDEPVSFTIAGRGWYNTRDLRADECVPIWANYVQVPDLDIIQIYAQKLANIDRTIEIAVKNARRSRLLIGGKNTRLTLAEISRQIDEGQATIGVGTNYDVESIKEVDMGSDPKNIEVLQVARTRLWNECMGLLGINNANQDKKERLVADEVAANDQQVDAMRYVALNARRRACEEINYMYSDYLVEPVSVDFHITEQPSIPDMSEEVDNG